MPDRQRKQLIMRNLITLGGELERVWSGCRAVGVVLAEAYYTANPWVSAGYVSNRLPSVSKDTIRRRLERLVDLGLAETANVDNSKVYRACASPVRDTIRAVEDAMVVPPSNLVPVHRHQ